MAEIITLQAGGTVLRVSPSGGAVIDGQHQGVPFLRSYQPAADGVFDPLLAGSFPLVPFGNRLADNAFRFDGVTHRFSPNVAWDPLYLHGDGWLGEWDVLEKGERDASFVFRFSSPTSPHHYRTHQSFTVTPGAVAIALAVRNDGGHMALPFGLGHHFYLPLTPDTQLCAAAGDYWSEKEGHLPDRLEPRPEDLVFDAPRRLPRRWINNGFEGWDGRATIAWPENRLCLTIEAEHAFGRYFLFLPHDRQEPADTAPFFCFEPMTHTANGHHLNDLGGLRVLASGETLSARLLLTLQQTQTDDPSQDERHSGS